MKLWMSRRYMQNLVWSKRESRINFVLAELRMDGTMKTLENKYLK